jgi:predicted alpha-1,6-mannanase (GH76 family)
VNYGVATGDDSYAYVLPNSFARVADLDFVSGYWDDAQWYALAWLRAAEVTGNATYAAAANYIVQTLLEKYGFWTDACGGGVVWSLDNAYKNTITNALFITASAKLHAAGFPGAAGRAYDTWANDTL